MPAGKAGGRRRRILRLPILRRLDFRIRPSLCRRGNGGEGGAPLLQQRGRADGDDEARRHYRRRRLRELRMEVRQRGDVQVNTARPKLTMKERRFLAIIYPTGTIATGTDVGAKLYYRGFLTIAKRDRYGI